MDGGNGRCLASRNEKCEWRCDYHHDIKGEIHKVFMQSFPGKLLKFAFFYSKSSSSGRFRYEQLTPLADDFEIS